MAPPYAGRGSGRALGEQALRWARVEGYRGMRFNAVVVTNTASVRLWKSLGFEILGALPKGFRHPTHGFVGLQSCTAGADRGPAVRDRPAPADDRCRPTTPAKRCTAAGRRAIMISRNRQDLEEQLVNYPAGAEIVVTLLVLLVYAAVIAFMVALFMRTQWFTRGRPGAGDPEVRTPDDQHNSPQAG